MSDPKTTGAMAEQETKVPEQVTQKKVYEKPQIVYRAPLEAMAGVCSSGGKAVGGCTIVMS